MNRRDFLRAGAAGAALSAAAPYAPAFADDKPIRAGLIGCGWYGKSDLLRLLQIAPAEVVSLCDVDKKMLTDAADIVASRQKSKKKPRTYADYRDMLKEKDLDIVEVATPRRSTPHLMEARNNIVKEGKLGKVGLVEICCYYHMRATQNPPDT